MAANSDSSDSSSSSSSSYNGEDGISSSSSSTDGSQTPASMIDESDEDGIPQFLPLDAEPKPTMPQQHFQPQPMMHTPMPLQFSAPKQQPMLSAPPLHS